MTLEQALALANFLAVVGGLTFAGFQVRQGRKALEQSAEAHKADHAWHRQIAAQEALAQYSTSVYLSRLAKEFNYLEIGRSACVDLDLVEERFKAEPDLRQDLHALLNFYESLARGVIQGLYDEDVIKAARKGAMERAYTGFKCYIDARRKTGSPKAWLDLQVLIERWESSEPK